jgi:hypothetical protein
MFLLIVTTKRIDMIKNIEGIEYEAVEVKDPVFTCDGCAFSNVNCTLDYIKNLDFNTTNYCLENGTIWIKSEVKVKEQIMKDTTVNKGVKHDQEKPRYSLLPPFALEEVVKVLTFGSKKYADFNWMELENPNDRLFSATNRHMWAWQRGEKLDSETMCNHLASAITNLLFMLELELLNIKELEDNAKSNSL